jgi:Domain of unknown function (DUF4388)/Transposase
MHFWLVNCRLMSCRRGSGALAPSCPMDLQFPLTEAVSGGDVVPNVAARMDKDTRKSWDDAKKSALVAQIVSGKLSVKTACERGDLSPETIQDWVRVFRRTTLQALDEHLRQTFLIQGADAAALGSAEYTGTLDDIPIGDLIQTFQMGGKGGVITVTRDGKHSQIWCEKGEVVDAESGPLRGESALYRILSLERGQVLADFHAEPRERTIELPGNLLLLEAARRKDESKRLLDRLGDHPAIYRRGQVLPAPSSHTDRELLALCDGRRSLREVLDQSDHGDFETLSALSRLVERRELVQYGVAIAPQPLPVAITLSKDTPHTRVSLGPLVASQRPETPRRRLSPLAFVGAGMAFGSVVWMVAAALPRATSHSARPLTALEPPRSKQASMRSFQVDSSVEPEHAELWLDGVKVGTGQLRRELPRDGTPHSLRIVAAGHAPTTLLFVDAPPPPHIELEILSPPPRELSPGNLPPVTDAPSNAPPGAPDNAVSGTPPRSGWRRPSATIRAKRASVTVKTLTESAASEHEKAETTPATSANLPRVQIIDDDKPVVQVIE